MSKVKIIGLIATALFVALIGTAQGPPPQLITLPGVDVAELERCGNLKLLLPDGAPRVTAGQAQEVAKANNPFDLPVQQTALARLVREGPPELVYRDNLVWVVVLSDGAVHQVDTGGPVVDPGRPPLSFTYDLIMVDAVTGELADGIIGPASPEYVTTSCPP